jgi:hypothetical protein
MQEYEFPPGYHGADGLAECGPLLNGHCKMLDQAFHGVLLLPRALEELEHL